MINMAKFLMFLLLYIVVATTLIAIFATGLMGASGVPYATVDYRPPENETDNYFIPNFIENAIDTGGMATAFLGAIYNILLYNVSEEILPLWANVIFIKIPLLILIVAVIEVFLP